MHTQELPAQGVRVQGAPKLSVIMPVHDAEATLAEAVDSVLSQSLEDLELVCVDDGSTDGSPAILRGYEERDPRVRVIAQGNAGAGAARNRGLEAASGEYVHFLDADDRVLPYAYECLCDKVEKYDLDMLRCAAVDWDVGRGCYVEKARNSLSRLRPGDFGRLVGTEEGSPVYQVAVAPWAGISRREFLMERGIRFNGLVCVNDRSFFAAEVTNARRMMVCRDRAVLHRDGQAGSLVGRRAGHFDCHFRSIEIVVERMEADGVDPEVRRRVLEQEFDDLFAWYRRLGADPAYGDAIEEQTEAFVEGYDGPFAWVLRDRYRDTRNRLVRQGGAAPAADREVRVEHEACEAPKVSVVVPVYNVEDYLNEAMDGLVNQTMEEMEFVCVNDGSTDGSLAILREYAALDRRIRVLDGPNGGYGKAMNRGIDAARGEYLGILEPDDFVPHEMYAELYERARESDADLVKADFYRFWTGPNGDLRSNVGRLSSKRSFYNRIFCPSEEQGCFSCCVNTWSGLYRLEFLNRWHIRHNETPGASYQDNGFLFKAFCRAERALFVDKPYYMYRQDNPGASMNSRSKMYAITTEYRLIWEWLEQDPELLGKVESVYLQKKLASFFVTLYRLDPSLQSDYVHHMHDEFEEPYRNGLIKEKDIFGLTNWRRFIQIMENPDAYLDQVCVSVIMPVYNVEPYLRQTLDSLLDRNELPFEVICVDDGSTDGSLAILREYEARDPRVRVVAQANAGAGAARNKGLEVARGEYLSFLDADDLFESDMLRKAYDRAVELDADVVVFRSDSFYEGEGGIVPNGYSIKRNLLPSHEPFSGADIPVNIFDVFTGWTWDKLFRADFVRKNGLSFLEQRTINDQTFTFSAILKAERIGTSNSVLVHWRKHEGSLSATKEGSWRCFYDALAALRQQLRDWGLFERREQDFVNYALFFSLWNLNTICGEAYYQLYEALKNGWLEDLGVLGRPADYFYSSYNYLQLQVLLSSNADEFLFWRLDQTKTQRDKFSRQLGEMRKDLKSRQADERKLTAANKKLEAKVRAQQSEIRELRSSTAWKVGRFITWIPRKIKGWWLGRRRRG